MRFQNCLKAICGVSVLVACAISRADSKADAQKAANAANLRAIGAAIRAYHAPTQAELGAAQAASAAATTAPTTRPTSGPSADYWVIDWSVFVAEPTGDHANSEDSIKSTFPAFVITRRSEVEAEKQDEHAVDTSTRLGEEKPSGPMPIGVIRVVGGAVPSAKFDVLLNVPSGEFESQWPRAESRSNRLLWSNLVASDEVPSLEPLGENDWMKHLRDGESHYLTSSGESRGERFLMYDASPALPVAIKVEVSGDNAYKITNIGSPDLADFEIYKGKVDGWRSARVDSLIGTHVPVAKVVGGNEPKIAAGDTLSITVSGANGEDDSVRSLHVSPSGGVSMPGIGNINVVGKTTDEAQAAIVEVYKNRNMPVGDIKVEIAPQAGAAATNGTTGPTTEPAGPAAVMALSGSAVADPKQLLAGWKDRLAAAGVQAADVNVILNILGKYAIDPGRLTAVYLLSSSQMDDLLPMEIVPSPAKVTRVGIVVLRNIDPAINDEIDQLVKQLGDDDWAKREAAQKKLTVFGRAAKGAVEKSSHSKDMEVVWRSEAILHAIDPKAPVQQ